MPGETAPDELEAHLTAFIRSFGLHHSERTPCGEPISVSQAHALGELAREPLTQSELADRLRLERSAVSRLVDALERRGWAERAPHPGDRRAVHVLLTADGQLAATRLAGARRARFAALLDGIPEERRADVLDSLALLASAMDRRSGERIRG